jgi:hypothetical protein
MTGDRPGAYNSIRLLCSVSLKGLHDRDAREPNRPDLIRRLNYAFAGLLPLWRLLLAVRKCADECNHLSKGVSDYFIGQIDWLGKI